MPPNRNPILEKMLAMMRQRGNGQQASPGLFVQQPGPGQLPMGGGSQSAGAGMMDAAKSFGQAGMGVANGIRNVGQNIVSGMTGFGGIASGIEGIAMAAGQGRTNDAVMQAVQESEDLIQQAKQLPQGSPQRRELLAKATQVAEQASMVAGKFAENAERAMDPMKPLGGAIQAGVSAAGMAAAPALNAMPGLRQAISQPLQAGVGIAGRVAGGYLGGRVQQAGEEMIQGQDVKPQDALKSERSEKGGKYGAAAAGVFEVGKAVLPPLFDKMRQKPGQQAPAGNFSPQDTSRLNEIDEAIKLKQEIVDNVTAQGGGQARGGPMTPMSGFKATMDISGDIDDIASLKVERASLLGKYGIGADDLPRGAVADDVGGYKQYDPAGEFDNQQSMSYEDLINRESMANEVLEGATAEDLMAKHGISQSNADDIVLMANDESFNPRGGLSLTEDGITDESGRVATSGAYDPATDTYTPNKYPKAGPGSGQKVWEVDAVVKEGGKTFTRSAQVVANSKAEALAKANAGDLHMSDVWVDDAMPSKGANAPFTDAYPAAEQDLGGSNPLSGKKVIGLGPDDTVRSSTPTIDQDIPRDQIEYPDDISLRSGSKKAVAGFMDKVRGEYAFDPEGQLGDVVKDVDISYRGGTLKVDVSELFPEIAERDGEVFMGASQNYLGGGIAGRINGGSSFDPSDLGPEQKEIYKSLQTEFKKLFYELNNGGGDDYMQSLGRGFDDNQGMDTSYPGLGPKGPTDDVSLRSGTPPPSTAVDDPGAYNPKTGTYEQAGDDVSLRSGVSQSHFDALNDAIDSLEQGSEEYKVVSKILSKYPNIKASEAVKIVEEARVGLDRLPADLTPEEYGGAPSDDVSLRGRFTLEDADEQAIINDYPPARVKYAQGVKGSRDYVASKLVTKYGMSNRDALELATAVKRLENAPVRSMKSLGPKAPAR